MYVSAGRPSGVANQRDRLSHLNFVAFGDQIQRIMAITCHKSATMIYFDHIDSRAKDQPVAEQLIGAEPVDVSHVLEPGRVRGNIKVKIIN
jgi:hypothetical protein